MMTIKEMESKRVDLFLEMVEVKEKLSNCNNESEKLDLIDELENLELEYKRFGSIIRQLI